MIDLMTVLVNPMMIRAPLSFCSDAIRVRGAVGGSATPIRRASCVAPTANSKLKPQNSNLDPPPAWDHWGPDGEAAQPPAPWETDGGEYAAWETAPPPRGARILGR